MTRFAVNEGKNQWLRQKMETLRIQEKDLEERFVRSSGKGGQKVNKTSSCVFLKHLPTGIEVKCMRERSQSVNRYLARRELIERIEKLAGYETTKDIRGEKIRKQKLRRITRSRLRHDGVV